AVLPGQVDAGLDREGVAGYQRVAVSAHQVGILVFFQTDAVTGAMDELRPVSSCFDQPPGDAVHVFARRAHGCRRNPFRLRFLQHLVEVAELARRLSGEYGAGDVRAVTVEGAPEVADDGFAGF